MPVVSEGFAVYDHVTVQVALDHWLDDDRRTSSLVGISRFPFCHPAPIPAL